MKHVGTISAAVTGLKLFLLTSLVSSCELLNPAPECPEPTYYPFNEADQQWQHFAVESQWVFENQRHERRTYSISRVQKEVKKPTWVSGSQIEYLDYYSDYWDMRIERTDSAASVGSFTLKRVPVYQLYDRSRLDARFYWPGYVGQHSDMGGTFSDYLEFGNDLTLINFHSLTVKEMNYSYVSSFRASNTAIVRLASFNNREQTSELDYDRDAGVVRFVTTKGIVWERIR